MLRTAIKKSLVADADDPATAYERLPWGADRGTHVRPGEYRITAIATVGRAHATYRDAPLLPKPWSEWRGLSA